MLINQDFSVDRTQYIGGSDIGAILGLSKYKSPLEVWMEKTGKGTKVANSLPLRFGSFAEEFVASEYALATESLLLHDDSIRIHPEHFFMSAHIDRFVLGDGQDLPPTKILECKTANAFSVNQWGEAGTDQVPINYLAQCIWYMAITGINQADLAVLFGNTEFRIYEITRDQDLENLILQKAKHFWHEYVQKDVPPPPHNEQDCQALFSKSDHSKTVNASHDTYELGKQYHQIHHQIESLESKLSDIKQSIMMQMGDAEILRYHDQVVATWKSPKLSLRLDTKQLEIDHPTLCSKYKKTVASARRLVIKDLKS